MNTFSMLHRTKWIDREFNFDFPNGWLPNITERLYGTSSRLKDIVSPLSDDFLSESHFNKWSIKTHIGHLIDLEELHQGRVHEFILRKNVLRPADMTNKKTETGQHNDKVIGVLLNEFNLKRNHLIDLFEKLDEETQDLKSLHPRLNKLIRPVDLAYFIAEHDDHHLADIRAIIKYFK